MNNGESSDGQLLSEGRELQINNPVPGITDRFKEINRTTELTIAIAKKQFLALLDSDFDTSDQIQVSREAGEVTEPYYYGSWRSIEFTFNVTGDEIATAPEPIQALFSDLGINHNDTLRMNLEVSKYANDSYDPDGAITWRFVPGEESNNKYGLNLELYIDRFTLLKSGGRLPTRHEDYLQGALPEEETERSKEIADIYNTLAFRGGIVSSHEIKYQPAVRIEYKHEPHPILAVFYKEVAEWTQQLIAKRAASRS